MIRSLCFLLVVLVAAEARQGRLPLGEDVWSCLFLRKLSRTLTYVFKWWSDILTRDLHGHRHDSSVGRQLRQDESTSDHDCVNRLVCSTLLGE